MRIAITVAEHTAGFMDHGQIKHILHPALGLLHGWAGGVKRRAVQPGRHGEQMFQLDVTFFPACILKDAALVLVNQPFVLALDVSITDRPANEHSDHALGHGLDMHFCRGSVRMEIGFCHYISVADNNDGMDACSVG